MKKTLTILVITIYFCGCVSKDDQKAVDALYESIKPNEIEIGTGVSVSTNKEQVNFKSYTLTGGDILSNPNISDVSIASMSVLLVYQNYSQKPLGHDNAIKIIIERPSESKTKTAEYVYYCDTLGFANDLVTECETIIQSIKNKKYDYVYNKLHENNKHNMTIGVFEGEFKKVDSLYGEIEFSQVISFNTQGSLPVNNSNKRLRIISYEIILRRKTMKNKIYLYYGLGVASKKILGIKLTKIE